MSFRKCRNPLCDNLLDAFEGRFYCNNKCRQQAYRVRVKGVSDKRSLIASQLTHCRNCGKCFVKVSLSHEFCCTSCRVSFWQQMQRLAEEDRRDEK